MIRLLLILLCLSLSLNSYSQELKKVTAKNKHLGYKETYYVLKEAPEIKHGEYSRNGNGEYRVKGQYENNKKVGVWEYYGWKGRLSQKFNYSTNTVEFDRPLPDQKYDTLSYSRPPLYPGGFDFMGIQWAQHVRYSVEAIRNRIQGVVILKVQVNEEGTLTSVTVAEGVGYGLDEEAVRVFKLLADPFIPALDKEGKTTAAEFKYPFKFRLM